MSEALRQWQKDILEKNKNLDHIIKMLRAKGYFIKNSKINENDNVDNIDITGLIKIYDYDKDGDTEILTKAEAYITINLFNILVDDVFYMNRMLKDFPSIYFTINRKVIDEINSEIYINKKINVNNEREALEALEFWANSLPILNEDIRKYIDSCNELD